MATPLWQHPRWPTFTWDHARLETPLAEARYRHGLLLGRMEAAGVAAREDTSRRVLAEEVAASGALAAAPDGIAEILRDATAHFQKPLTVDRLRAWRAALGGDAPHGWRATAREDAPPPARLEAEMTAFLAWIDGGAKIDPVLKAGLAHVWCAVLAPFDGGNGRIARAVSAMMLARADGAPLRFYSLSAEIVRQQAVYERGLEHSRTADLDMTPWLSWFLRAYTRAVTLALEQSQTTVFVELPKVDLNARQRLVLAQLAAGLDTPLTTSAWANLAVCSQDTAHRDIRDLIAKGVLRKDAAGGRSTRYVMQAPRRAPPAS